MSQQNSSNRILPVLIFLLIALPLFAAMGAYCGAWVFTHWKGLRSTPSLTLLYQYWHVANLPAHLIKPLKISTALAVLIGILPLLVMIIGALVKPRRELHGSSRFANASEIRQAGLLDVDKKRRKKSNKRQDNLPDLLIGKWNNQYLRWQGSEFLYLSAPTRSGKGVGIVIPNCLHYWHSMVVYDPKLENFLITAGWRERVLKQKVFLFNPSGKMPEHEQNPNAPLASHKWNPMTYIRRDARFTFKDLSNMATILFPTPTRGADGSSMFFIESARKLFVGLGLYLIETEKDLHRDLSDIRQRTTITNLFKLTTPSDGTSLSAWLAKTIKLREQKPQTDLSEPCKTLLREFINSDKETAQNILSSMTAPLGIFLDPIVEAATSDDDFRLDRVRQERMTIYIGVIPTEAATFSRLLNLFFSQLIDVNVQQGLPENNPRLQYQCLLLMDEFTALGNIPAVQHGVSYIAGYGLRLLIIIQAPSQVEAVYGRENMKTFFTNFTCRIFYTPREQDDCEEYSKVIGYETFKAKSQSRSRGKGSSNSTSTSDQRRAVMNPDELRLMPFEDCVINLGGNRAIYAQKIIYHEDPVFKKRLGYARPYVSVLQAKSKNTDEPNHANRQAAEVPDKLLHTVSLNDVLNRQEAAVALLKQSCLPSNPPQYIQACVQYVANIWQLNPQKLHEAWLAANEVV